MDISIIISGNLTGFSRFYASPNANDIYNEAKFDFDYRNFLTFINAGEKAYAISFSPKVIAVSLITRILDSFRRPGILVVTALIPRYQLVSGTLNAQDKSAIYNLLNEINDKFYEKNFLNGMINQNPAVLMQDYYSDILRNYTLVSDRMQKAVNTAIEVNSPNKRIGYVSTNEKDIPRYLSSLMRKSYNGYHHVFFADNAPANIDEPAEEIVTYKVRVSNDNRPIPGEVRLDDKIPSVSPHQGELPITNQNYTYKQVLNGDAGNEITATLENDTIVLTYRFQQEEKTVYFKFYDGPNEVPIHVIRPLIVESNGSRYPLSTDSWTFRGKEIYGLKTIMSGISEYTVEPNSSRLDLQRIPEGATHNVYVSKGWTWIFDPMINNRRANIKPISITLVNKYTGERKYLARVTGYVTEKLSGSAQEWEMQIESDYYKSGTFPASGPYRLEPKPHSTPVSHGTGSQHADVQRGGGQKRVQGIQSSNQDLKLSGGQQDTAKETARIKEEQKKLYIRYGICAVVAIICCLGVWWVYNALNKEDKKVDRVQSDDGLVTQNVTFVLGDGSNQPKIESANLELLKLTIEAPEGVKIIDDDNDLYSRTIIYNPEEAHDSIKVEVRFKGNGENNPLIFASKRYSLKELKKDSVHVTLSVRNSELTSYRELSEGKIPDGLDKQIKRLSENDDDNMKAYADCLSNMKGVIELRARVNADPVNKAVGGDSRPNQPKTDSNIAAKNRFHDTGLTLENLKGMEPTPDEINSKEDLTVVLTDIENGKCPSIKDNLSDAQKKIINDLKEKWETIDNLPESTPGEKSKKQGIKTKYKKALHNKDRNKNSLNTARDALSVMI